MKDVNSLGSKLALIFSIHKSHKREQQGGLDLRAKRSHACEIALLRAFPRPTEITTCFRTSLRKLVELSHTSLTRRVSSKIKASGTMEKIASRSSRRNSLFSSQYRSGASVLFEARSSLSSFVHLKINKIKRLFRVVALLADDAKVETITRFYKRIESANSVITRNSFVLAMDKF